MRMSSQNNNAKLSTPLNVARCDECGQTFPPRDRRQRICLSPDCHRAQQRKYMAQYRADGRAIEWTRRSEEKRKVRAATDPAYRERRRELERIRYHRRRAQGVSQHHIVPQEDYERMFVTQGGLCAICREPETAKDPSGRTKRLAVDHDSRAGAVRGLLCARCNTAIGLLRHDPERVQAAVDYLVRHGLRLLG